MKLTPNDVKELGQILKFHAYTDYGMKIVPGDKNPNCLVHNGSFLLSDNKIDIYDENDIPIGLVEDLVKDSAYMNCYDPRENILPILGLRNIFLVYKKGVSLKAFKTMASVSMGIQVCILLKIKAQRQFKRNTKKG